MADKSVDTLIQISFQFQAQQKQLCVCAYLFPLCTIFQQKQKAKLRMKEIGNKSHKNAVALKCRHLNKWSLMYVNSKWPFESQNDTVNCESISNCNFCFCLV